MTQMAALFYGLLATFVLSSVSRNRRERRADPTILTLGSWVLIGFSGAFGLILLAYAGWKALGGGA
jgi:hypothetical protein